MRAETPVFVPAVCTFLASGDPWHVLAHELSVLLEMMIIS